MNFLYIKEGSHFEISKNTKVRPDRTLNISHNFNGGKTKQSFRAYMPYVPKKYKKFKISSTFYGTVYKTLKFVLQEQQSKEYQLVFKIFNFTLRL